MNNLGEKENSSPFVHVGFIRNVNINNGPGAQNSLLFSLTIHLAAIINRLQACIRRMSNDHDR